MELTYKQPIKPQTPNSEPHRPKTPTLYEKVIDILMPANRSYNSYLHVKLGFIPKLTIYCG